MENVVLDLIEFPAQIFNLPAYLAHFEAGYCNLDLIFFVIVRVNMSRYKIASNLQKYDFLTMKKFIFCISIY